MTMKLNFKKSIVNLLKEDDSFFYLAPDVIGSVNNANLDLGKNTFTIDFGTTDGREMALVVPAPNFEKWSDENADLEVMDYLMNFVTNSKEANEDEEMLDEIVDEYGMLMADEDEPSNKNFVYVGKSKFDTNKTIKQTVPKSKRFYGDLGLGVVTW